MTVKIIQSTRVTCISEIPMGEFFIFGDMGLCQRVTTPQGEASKRYYYVQVKTGVIDWTDAGQSVQHVDVELAWSQRGSK